MCWYHSPHSDAHPSNGHCPQLLRAPALPLLDRLRLLLTTSDILRGQGEALNVDRRDFYVQLYEALTLMPYAQISEDPPSTGD